MRRVLLPAFVLCAGLAPAQAASEDAWKAFRADVLKACQKALADHLVNPAITVDPFGSESYGVAIARGVYKGSTKKSLMVCIFDKKTMKAEVSGEFDP